MVFESVSVHWPAIILATADQNKILSVIWIDN